MRYPILLPLKHPRKAYQWRLVTSVYESARAIIEGAAVLILMAACCAYEAHSAIFVGIALAAFLVTALRMWDRRAFMRARAEGGDAMRGTPEGWMKRQAVGALASASVWGTQQACVLLLTQDPQLQFASLMLQAGWIAGACVRTAASPAAVLGQVVVSLGPTLLGLFLAPGGFIRIAIPMGLLHVAALLRISRSLGLLLMQNMDCEHCVDTANTQLAEANARLRQLSLIDGLTGIANRRAFDEALDAEWQRAGRERGPVALLMIDVDNFKLFNDRYGHQAGDDCLRQVAQIAAATLSRPTDLAARYGGEEFIALLPDTGEDGAFEVAERLLRAIAGVSIPHEAVASGHISVSIGVASLRPAEGGDKQSLVRLADDALYLAKRQGRERVHRAGMSPQTQGVQVAAA